MPPAATGGIIFPAIASYRQKSSNPYAHAYQKSIPPMKA
jgi:hypothetical protein